MISLFFVIFINLVSFSFAAIDEFPRREYSLTKPFHGAGTSLFNWQLSGSAVAMPTHIQLTDDVPSQLGAVWNVNKCTLRHWEIEVHFKVHGKGQELFGDGFAIWYARDRSLCPGGAHCTVFGNNNLFSGLGVFFDTYNNYNGVHNHEHPYISVMVNNGSMHYDHDTDGTHTQVAGCAAKFRGRSHDTRTRVRYLHDQLSVYVDVENSGSWHQCVAPSPVLLPTGYYWGVSAVTGDLSDRHDLLAVRVTQLDPLLETPEQQLLEEQDISRRVPSAVMSQPPRERVNDTPSSSVWSGLRKLLWLSAAVVALCVAVVGGAYWFSTRRENTRKRFY